MFNGIAPKYDILNTILSFGIHHLWRRKTVNVGALKANSRLLDCATGTGDLAIAFKKSNPLVGVTGLDFSNKMLEIAQKKIKNVSLDIDLLTGDILSLPFKNNSFDAVSISFGIRNVDNTLLGLKEMARVTSAGGKIIILEFGQPTGFMNLIYRIYSNTIMPFIGRIFSGNEGAYKYLPATALSYPCREKFIKIMNETNMLESCNYYSLSGGIAYLYVGTVKE